MTKIKKQTCDGCGKSPAMYIQDRDETLCVSCIRMYAVTDGMEKEALTVLEDKVNAWKHRGIPIETIRDALEGFTDTRGFETMLQNVSV